MSIKTQWSELLLSIQAGNLSELSNLVNLINKAKKHPTEDIIQECEEELQRVDNIIKELPEKEYKQIDKLIKSQLVSLKSALKRNKVQKVTRWDVFVDEAFNREEGWQPVVDLINYVQLKENEEITKEDIDEFEKKIKELSEYMKENLSPFDRDWTIKEFNKKLRIFKNRVNRVIEEDFGAWVKQLRKAKGYSLMDLENKSGVTASYIYRIETGSRKTPSIPIAEKLALGLGINPEEFIKKLNLGIKETKTQELAELITLNDFTIDNKLASNNQKEQIIKLLNKVMYAEWNENTKLTEGMEILNLIDKIKKDLD